MRTSSSQFDLMVTFMEQHGDLSKPSKNSSDKIKTMQKWEELVLSLNSDGSGDSKTVEKWKKVWSDYKNNTKKKAFRLHRAAIGIGGGSATRTKLTDLELRVIKIVGEQMVTGLVVKEADLLQRSDKYRVETQQRRALPLRSTSVENQPCENEPAINTIDWGISSSPRLILAQVQSPQPGSPTSSMATAVSPLQARFLSSPLPTSVQVEEEYEIFPSTSPHRQSPLDNIGQAEPSLSGVTTHRFTRRQRRPRGSHRRCVDQAAQDFDRERWRKFRMQQHKDYMDMKRKQNRIRLLEIDTQRQWQSFGFSILKLFEKIVDKYCKE